MPLTRFRARVGHAPTRGRTRRRHALVGVVAALLAATAGCGDEPSVSDSERMRGGVLQPPVDLGRLALPDATSGDADFAFTAPAGGLLIVFFGYTACPDFCPTTLADLGLGLKTVDPEVAEKVEVAMVTVDPTRDDGPRLADYVSTFVPNGHALRTDDPDALLEITDAFGARFDVSDNGTEPANVEHTVTVFGVNDAAQLIVQWPHGTSANDFASDFDKLVNANADSK